MWSSISIKYIAKKADGRSGGILLMWDDLKYKAVNSLEGDFSVSVNFVENDGYS